MSEKKNVFSFWIENYRVSFLIAFLIFFSGIFSLYQIPKESSPDIKFGIILISTIYPGVSPADIDNLITHEIEKEIQDLDGIKKITSQSAVGFSSITVELDNGVNTRDIMTDIKDKVDKISFPDDAEDPIVQEISTSSELMFQALLYAPENQKTVFELQTLAKKIQKDLEGKNGVVSIDVASGISGDIVSGSSAGNEDYTIKILFQKDKMDVLGLKIQDVAQIIRSYNRNTPIGNYDLGDLSYDFRFDGEFKNLEDIKNISLRNSNGSVILLKDIATFEKTYGDTPPIRKIGFYNNAGYNYISLNFNKKSGSNVFAVSQKAKENIEKYISENIEFKNVGVTYVRDLSEVIKDDYKQLSSNAIQTLVFVFLIVFLFIGVRESFIASILIILAFAVTFTSLDVLGRSLNFLTNFSLVLSFGIAVDTLTVIIEGAVQKQKLGYSKMQAVFLASNELRSSLITGTFATLFAFLPMIFLPGIIGKFLSYIPITTFFMLGAALFISLTLVGAFFVKMSREMPFYFQDSFQEDLLTPEQKEILAMSRKDKYESEPTKESKRLQFLGKLGEKYYVAIQFFMRAKKYRLFAVFAPVFLLIATFVFLSSNIGFTLFPQSDEGQVNITIESRNGTNQKSLEKFLPEIEKKISGYQELHAFFSEISGNTIKVYLELIPLSERKDKNMKSAFEIESEILESFRFLESQGLKVSVKSQGGGPPVTKPVGIKLIVDDARNMSELRRVASDFQNYLLTLKGLKNIALSSADNPGQFIFTFNNEKLNALGISPPEILGDIYSAINGSKAGALKSQGGDNDIELKMDAFDTSLSPEDILNLQIATRIGTIRVGDYVSYSFEEALSSISRENGNITLTVDADVESGVVPTTLQPKLIEFANSYKFPDGVSYSAGGENQENKELIISTIRSFFIALFLIFAILVFQFNSYSQPMMILYSAILSLGGVNIGLFLTGNPYSMPFAIGFISLLGILVNNSIILIETINSNLKKAKIVSPHMTEKEYRGAIMAAGMSRLQAIIITLVINLVGILPIAFQDPFWAGIGFTIVFGLISGTFLTLFSLPSLYYMLYFKRYVK